MRRLLLAMVLTGLAMPALAQSKPGEPLPFETLKDAYDRQRAEDYRVRQDSRSLLRNDRPTALGDSRVNAVPAPERYTTQPVSSRK